MAVDGKINIPFYLKQWCWFIGFPILFFVSSILSTSPISLKKNKSVRGHQVFIKTSVCSWLISFTISQKMRAQAVQPHFAKIKQEELTLIALQVCYCWMTRIDGFEIYWQAAWLSELNLQLTVLSVSVLHSEGLPLLRWKCTETPVLSVFSKQRMSPVPSLFLYNRNNIKNH